MPVRVEPRVCKKGLLHGVQEGEEVVKKQEQETADRDTAAKKAEADAKRRQQEAAHNDAVAAFQTLLAETVKDSSARWQVSTSSAYRLQSLSLELQQPATDCSQVSEFLSLQRSNSLSVARDNVPDACMLHSVSTQASAGDST